MRSNGKNIQKKRARRFYSASPWTSSGGGGWIRTIEGITSRFTVCPLWPLGNSTIFYGAGKGSRTPITSLEGWCTTVMPYPQLFINRKYMPVARSCNASLPYLNSSHFNPSKGSEWYRRWESNPHSVKNCDLNAARLPIPPRRRPQTSISCMSLKIDLFLRNANSTATFFAKKNTFLPFLSENNFNTARLATQAKLFWRYLWLILY